MNVIREQSVNVKDLLRAFIGRHAMPVKECSTKTGISERQIHTHLSSDGSMPNADHMTAYLRILPDAFAGAYLGRSGIRHYRATSMIGNRLCPSSVLPGAGKVVTLVSEAWSDRVFDHREIREIKPTLWDVGAHFQTVSAQL